MEHPTHKLNAYKDDSFKWVTYCEKCSREEENLIEPCPGTFVDKSYLNIVDKPKEAA